MKKVFKFFNKTEELTASSLLIITSLLVFVQVLMRYMFNYSISWTEEVARYMIAWFIFLGSSIAVKENAHVNMDALSNLIKGKISQVISIIIDLINIAFCILTIMAGVKMIQSSISLGTIATSIPLPLYIPYASVPVGVSFMLVRYVFSIVNRIIDLVNGKEVRE
ncbi:TRAP transporter small permease [Clostridium sp. D2Q-14]|uniref:TRAP transporter small permease n=1 Tax=Anaeromonas gelatinilytica TaxID=2683194 RepID=UPI00193B2084|nr:TRAP transporter small permease [Anaeromonas gelatinilytica]MBS4535059.1 TRAP transporter small permease [Anaeromonas gelatinilytica]